jgi:hypothetical protein
MTFKEAKDELKKLAKGKYHAIRYELVEYSSGKIETECWIYIDPRISVSTTNWKDALTKMEMILEPLKADPSEIPGEELEDAPL